MKVEAFRDDKTLIIKINGLTHLYLKRDELVGYKSYFENEKQYFIIIHCRTTSIELEYETWGLWQQVLVLLAEHI